MDGVSTSLESEEQESLSRLSLAQAGFAEEVLGQITDEAAFVTAIAQDMWTGVLNVSSAAVPLNRERVQLPFDATTPRVLNYDTPQYSHASCSPTYTINCFLDPPPLPGSHASLSTIRTGELGSPLSSAVYWPHPRSAGAALSPDLDYEYAALDALPSELLHEIDQSAYLEEFLQQTYEANPAIELAYIGYRGKGTFRTYPYTRATSRTTKWYTSARDGVTRQGYDPRHRPWFIDAETKGTLIVSPPYEDATTGELVITIAAPVFDADGVTVIAVTGFDVSIAALQRLVLSSKVLREGYAYLADRSGELVVYGPGLAVEDIGDAKVWDKEFDAAHGPAAAAAFRADVWQSMAAGEHATTTYTQGDGALWHIAYAPVPSANYSLAFVVPDRDILLPATQTATLIRSLTRQQAVIFALVMISAAFVFTRVMGQVAVSVTKPVRSLKRVIDLIIHDINRKETAHGDVKRDQPFQLHLRQIIPAEAESSIEVTKMKEAFEYMLMALRFGSEAYSKKDIAAAEQVYREALSMFTTLQNERGVGICTFNLGVVAHNRFLTSDKTNVAAAAEAKRCYLASIANGRELWQAIVGGPGEPTTGDSASKKDGERAAHVAVDMKSADAPRTDFVGHDMADKLASRLSHLAQLHMDHLTPTSYEDAEPLLGEALRLDALTHNVLGYAQRVGQMCQVQVGLGRFDVAVATIKAQLDSLRAQVAEVERARVAHEGTATDTKTAPPAHKRHENEGVDEQRRDELQQALQHALYDAARIQASAGGDEKRALRLYTEALSCTARCASSMLANIWDGIGQLIERHREDGTIEPATLKRVDAELRQHGVGLAREKDVVFVVDYSGSMSGGKMRRAREGIKSVVQQQLKMHDRVAIVKFSSDVTLVQDLQRKGSHVFAAVDSLTMPQGQTALWDAIGTALQQFGDSREREPWVVVVTDGADNSSSKWSPAATPTDCDVLQAGARVLCKWRDSKWLPAVITGTSYGNRSRRVAVRYDDGEVERNVEASRIKPDNRLAIPPFLQRIAANLVILAVGVDQREAMANMQALAREVPAEQVGELIDIQSSEQIDSAFETISRLVGRNLQVQQY